METTIRGGSSRPHKYWVIFRLLHCTSEPNVRPKLLTKTTLNPKRLARRGAGQRSGAPAGGMHWDVSKRGALCHLRTLRYRDRKSSGFRV